MIEAYLAAAPSHSEGEINHDRLRGIICPHIDYERGGHVYAQIWRHAAASIRQAELVIILGTDHFSEGIPISLTRQDYCTPLGRLVADQDALMPLVSMMGESAAEKHWHTPPVQRISKTHLTLPSAGYRSFEHKKTPGRCFFVLTRQQDEITRQPLSTTPIPPGYPPDRQAGGRCAPR